MAWTGPDMACIILPMNQAVFKSNADMRNLCPALSKGVIVGGKIL